MPCRMPKESDAQRPKDLELTTGRAITVAWETYAEARTETPDS